MIRVAGAIEMSLIFRRRATNRAVKTLVQSLRRRDWRKVEQGARGVLAVLADEPRETPVVSTDTEVDTLREEATAVWSAHAAGEPVGDAVGIDPMTILLIVQLVIQLIDAIRKAKS